MSRDTEPRRGDWPIGGCPDCNGLEVDCDRCNGTGYLPEPEPCPMGCGRTTEDVYGGPCKECWAHAT